MRPDKVSMGRKQLARMPLWLNSVLLTTLAYLLIRRQCGDNSVNVAHEELTALRAQVAGLLKIRIAYGELYCQLHGVGPTGGFCVNGTNDVGGNNAWDQPVCKRLAELFAGKTVLDFGCGLGHYGRCLSNGGSVRWTGYDGSEGIEKATGGFVKFMDLTVPQYLDQKYDWVMSLEVGEHIPAEFEGVFLQNIVRHAKEGVLLTWAVPGQGGHHHVNNKPNDYIVQRMLRFGFAHDQATSEHLRQIAQLPWFKDTIMFFRKN